MFITTTRSSVDPNVYPRIQKRYGEVTARKLAEGCAYYDGTQKVGQKKYFYPGQRVSPIIIGDQEDIYFYPVTALPSQLKREMEDPLTEALGAIGMKAYWLNRIKTGDVKSMSLPYLSEYLLTISPSGKPVFISDDHSHAVFAWLLAKEAGIIGERSALIHIDQHEDNSLDTMSDLRFASRFDRRLVCNFPRLYMETGNPLLKDVAEYAWGFLEINTFIDFALKTDEKVPGTFSLLNGDHVYYVLTAENGKHTFRYETFGFYSSSDGTPIDQGRPGTVVSLERGEEIFDGVRRENASASIICDIDLDYFYHFYLPDGRTKVLGFSFEEALKRVISLARQADFVTISTSPDFFLVMNQPDEMRNLLWRIVSAL